MKIHIPVLENMLAMARQHVALEQEAARRYKRDQGRDEHASAKIEMPAEDTNRTIQFDEPKKTHREVGFLIQRQSISWQRKTVA